MCRIPCVLVFALFVINTSGEKGCPKEWKYFEGHCYNWFADKVNWLGAQERCKAVGANLVQVDSESENQWLAENYKSEVIWLGGSDAAEEGTWRWIGTGEKIAYSNWAKYEPNNAGNNAGKKEDCLHMHFHYFKDNQEPGNWNDISCGNKYSYVCEKCSSK